MMEKENSSFWQKILKRFRYSLGLYKNPAYVEEKLLDADVRSMRFLGIIVAVVEVAMLVRYIAKYGDRCDSIGEFFQYTYGYWIMLISSGVMFAYSLFYLAGKMRRVRKYSRIFILLYFILTIWFGGATSIKDFSKGSMIICFLSMLMYATIIVIKRPFVSLILTVLPASIFLYVLDHYTYDDAGRQLTLSSGDKINYVIYVVSLVILEVSVYYQRYREAWEEYDLEKATITDDLTGIHNMRKFEQDSVKYVSQCISEGRYPLYLIIDIEHFQTFNDHFGYEGGDRFLIEVGKIIQDTFRNEPVARMAIDDFVVLTAREDYKNCLETIRDSVRNMYAAETYLDVKVGAFRAGSSSESPKYAIDRASYALKRLHNNEKEFLIEYDDAMGKEYSIKQYVLNNIDNAVNKGYIKVYYQPVIWSFDDTMSGCEALVRWVDPEKGMMNPGLFISTLEEGRLIHKLDLCVYETVCRQMYDSIEQGLPLIPVSLNFSRLDFELMDPVEEMEKLVNKYNIPRDYLHIEITESAVAKDIVLMKKAVERFRELGYSIWLDDFGSGYSSMNVLKDFEFDVLKIDMEFLKNFHDNPNSRTIISSVIRMAEKLNMHTICEGVETEEAIEFLKAAGCERLQGYYYSKPVPYSEILDKLKKQTLVMRV